VLVTVCQKWNIYGNIYIIPPTSNYY
jgi:hypothetical protein